MLAVRGFFSVLVLALGASLLSFGPSPARAAPSVRRPSRERADGESVGSPSRGHLVGGRALAPSPCLRMVGAYRWGVPELVDLVEHVCAKVAATHPGVVLTVGDLSKQGGGDIGGHHSHESGRDVDLGFYMIDRAGKPTHAPRFAVIRPDGTAKGMSGVRFDDEANWALVEAVLRESEVYVLRIFIADPLRARLLAYAAQHGVPAGLRERAAAVMVQPHHASPHDNHLHVRIACPPSDHACMNVALPERPARHGGRAGQLAARRAYGAGKR